MNSEQIILIVFRLINFIVLLGLIAYVWKKYLRAMVVSTYEQEQEHLVSLASKHVQLGKQERQLYKQFGDDTDERSLLKERLFAWREAVEKEREALAEYKQERLAIIEKNMKQQVRRITKYRLYSQLQADAVNQVREDLKKEFTSPEKQKKIMQSILKRMENA